MNAVIQSARADDATAIARVHIHGARASYPGQVIEGGPGRADSDQEVLAQRARHWGVWLQRSQASTVVARVGGTVVGFCALHRIQGATAEIAALHVLRAHWRHGIGRLLCERTFVEARTRGFEEIVLWVLESNERARLFYDSLGFRADGETRVFDERYGATLHEVHCRKDLRQGVRIPKAPAT